MTSTPDSFDPGPDGGPVRQRRKSEPDYVLSIPKRGPFGSDIQVEIHQFGGELLLDLKLNGEIEHTSRGVVYDHHASSLEEHAKAYLRYHTAQGLVLTDGETDQVEEWLSEPESA